MSTPLKNYADVQALLTSFVGVNSLTPGLAPHGVFWSTLTYDQFVGGPLPNIGVPILVKGNADQSNLIQVLKGTSATFPHMPSPNPPYNAKTPTQDAVIQLLSDWINANCPNNDNLTQVEGIGPEVHTLLRHRGISSFEQLSSTKVPFLRSLLKDNGHGEHDPGTWPAQANLAHNGELKSLKAIQAVLKGGKP